MRFDFSDLRRLLPSRLFRRRSRRGRSWGPSVVKSYPLLANADVFREQFVTSHREVAELGRAGRWAELIEKIKDDPSLVHSSELATPGGPSPAFRTPLHHAAGGGAPESVIGDLLDLGASRCMKTDEGQTAYDLARAARRDAAVLALLAVPEEIQRDQAAIERMEAGLHGVIDGRAGHLIREHGHRLPQLVFLYELIKEDQGFFYPVIGMYGGFRVYRVENGIQADSFIRVCGGSEQNHFIDREGNATLLPNDCPM